MSRQTENPKQNFQSSRDEEWWGIPTQIIKDWKSGEYYTGDILSSSYKNLGAALSLRGWYTYEEAAPNGNNPQFKGIAKIDLKDDKLFMGGIRLYEEKLEKSSSNKKKSMAQNKIRFWRSEFSHWLSDSEIIWFYHTFEFNMADDGAAFREKILGRYFYEDWLKKMSAYYAEDKFGLNSAPYDERKAWNRMLDALRGCFDNDIKQIEERCNNREDLISKIMLYHSIDSSGAKESRALYRQVYSPATRDKKLIAGTTLFKRVNKL